MATFQFKNSNYSVTPPQAGAASITNTSADAANFQQVITDLPVTSSTGVSVSGETLAILAIRIAGRVVPTGYETLQDFVLQQVEGFSLLDVTEQGSITSRTALELLRLNAGAFSADTATSLPRYKKLLNELEGAHDQFKDIVISGRRLFLGAPFEADVKEGFFDSSKHYIVVDEDDAADRLKLVKYNNKNNVNASYWFDAGTGSETTGLNTLNTRASKTSNSSQVNASKQFSFDGSSSSVVSTSNDTITISNHGFITGDTVFYEPEILHTIDSSNSTEVVLASNTFNISSHGYTNGDIIKYSFTASTDLGITGLTENQFYMVNKIDANNFRLLDLAQSFTDDTCDFTQLDATVTHTANSSIVAGLAIFGPDFLQVPAGGVTVATITDSTTFELSDDGVAAGANNVAGITFAPIIGITALGVGDHTFSCAYPRGIGAAAATIGRQEFFVIEVDTNNFKLATTADNADAGTAIDITAVGKGTEHTLEGNFTKELDVGQFVGVFEEFTFNGSSDVSSNQITIEGGAFAVSCNTGSDKDVTFSANTNILAGMNVRGSGIPAGTKVASVAANNQSCVLTKDATSSLTGTSLTFFTDHGFSTGDTADYSAGAGTKITNLNEGQRYFIIRVDESTVKLASTSADATAGTAITLSGGSGVSHTLSLNYGTKIYRIDDRNKIFTSSSDAQVFTNRDLKVPNWTLDPAKDAIVAKVYAYETTALVNGATSSSTSVNIDTITGEKILPGAVVTETTGGTNATNDDISGGGVKVVTSTQSIETTEGSITEENSSTAAITLNSAQTFIDNGSLTFKSFVVEPYVKLDSGDRVEDDIVPKLSADLDVNSKSLKSNSINLKTSGGTKLIETTATEAKLYHNGTEALKTISGGVQYTGNLSDGTTSIASFTPSGTGLAATDNNTTIPTSATVKAYVDASAGVPATGGTFTGDVTFSATGTADAGNTTKDSQGSLLFQASAWDANDSTARAQSVEIKLEAESNNIGRSDLVFYDGTEALGDKILELHGTNGSIVNPIAGGRDSATFHGNVRIDPSDSAYTGNGDLFLSAGTITVQPYGSTDAVNGCAFTVAAKSGTTNFTSDARTATGNATGISSSSLFSPALKTYSIYPKATLGATKFITVSEHDDEAVADEKFIQLDDSNANGTIGMRDMQFYQYDGAGTAASDMTKPQGKLLTVRAWEGSALQTKLSLDSDGNLTVPATVTANAFSGTATNATHVTVTDNENENENNLITFIEDASATGNVGLESDGDFHYNPSTGTVTASNFAAGGITASGDVAINTDTLFVDVSADKVGINDASPAYALDVTGDIRATANIIAFSDERLKSDIKTLDGKKVLDMRGVEFIKDGQKSSGVIAQELEKVAPELVVDDGQYKSVAYGNIVGYLIEAVKDLQKQVDDLKK